MKKNLMTVLILALLIVNIALTGVMLVSIVLFFFIQVDNVAEKVILRILLMPVVADGYHDA